MIKIYKCSQDERPDIAFVSLVITTLIMLVYIVTNSIEICCLLIYIIIGAFWTVYDIIEIVGEER